MKSHLSRCVVPILGTLFMGTQAAYAAPRFSVAFDFEEAIGPFKSWADAKTVYGAKGDGVTDDTAALQKALNEIGQTGKAAILYLPPGNYKITKSLVFNGSPSGMGVIGDAPATTKITWAGPAGAPMLINWAGSDGGNSFSRLTWDGQGKAGFGIVFWWDTSRSESLNGSSSKNIDEVFQDMGIGIMAGRLGSNFGSMDSEGLVQRVTFLRNSYAGLDNGSYNALDWWVYDSHFVDCGRGVTNSFTFTDNATVTFTAPAGTKYAANTSNGAGGMYVYRSLFERSTVADFEIGNTNWYSLQHNVSIGSNRFFYSFQAGTNAAQTIIQKNRIIDTIAPDSIVFGNEGPLILIDNLIRSRPGAVAPVVTVNDWDPGRDVLSVGNSYTVANPIQVYDAKQDRHVSIDDQTVAYSSIDGSLPSVPATPAWSNRQVFEVAPGAGSAAIQTAIDQAVASGAVNPVVHLPVGIYRLTATLAIPAKARIQIAGDGNGTHLSGSPALTMMQLNGPSYATIRDLQFYGWAADSKVTAIGINSADQPGGRILLANSMLGPVIAANLVQTQLNLQANPAIGNKEDGSPNFSISNVQNAVSISNGSFGPFVSAGTSSILIMDSWYEGRVSNLCTMSNGDFTFMGGSLGPATHSPAVGPVVPPISLDNFSGHATYIGVQVDGTNIPNDVGIYIGPEIGGKTNALFLGVHLIGNTVFKRTASGSNVGLYMAKNSPSGEAVNIPNVGRTDPAWIEGMIYQARKLYWDSAPYSPPAGSTDVRVYRVTSTSSGVSTGVNVSGY